MLKDDHYLAKLQVADIVTLTTYDETLISLKGGEFLDKLRELASHRGQFHVVTGSSGEILWTR
jgi:hypothetical protein